MGQECKDRSDLITTIKHILLKVLIKVVPNIRFKI